MNRSTLLGAAIALLLGAGGVIVLGTLAESSDPQPVATSAVVSRPTTVVPPPVWVEAREVLAGPASLVPAGFSFEGATTLVFSYELTTLSPIGDQEAARIRANPQIGEEEIPPEDVPPIFPVAWTLITTDGEITATTTSNPRARSVRFQIDADTFDDATVEAVRLDRYLLPVPIDVEFDMALSDRVVVPAPGIRLSLGSIDINERQALVNVEVEADFSLNELNVTVEGVGPLWLNANRQANGRPPYTLVFDSSELPNPMPLRARGYAWVESGAAPVIIGVGAG